MSEQPQPSPSLEDIAHTNYDFDAPQFVDFNDLRDFGENDDDSENYFRSFGENKSDSSGNDVDVDSLSPTVQHLPLSGKIQDNSDSVNLADSKSQLMFHMDDIETEQGEDEEDKENIMGPIIKENIMGPVLNESSKAENSAGSQKHKRQSLKMEIGTSNVDYNYDTDGKEQVLFLRNAVSLDDLRSPNSVKDMYAANADELQHKRTDNIDITEPAANLQRKSSLYVANTVGVEIEWKENVHENYEEDANIEGKDPPTAIVEKEIVKASPSGASDEILEPKTRPAAVYGFIARAGITIPKTPDAGLRNRSKSTRKQDTSKQVSSTSSYDPTKKIAASGKRPPSSCSQYAYVPLAQQVSSFERSTPERFHSFNRNRASSAKSSKRAESPSPTRCGPSHLTALQRSRNSIRGQRGIENGKEDVKPISKIPGAVVPSRIHIKKFADLKPGTIKPFKATSIPHLTKTEQSEFQFRARPVPEKLFSGGPIGVKEKPVIKTTIPHAPHFLSDDRIQERRQKDIAALAHGNTSVHEVKQDKILQRRSLSVTRSESKEATKVQPFSFDGRDQMIKERKEETIRKAVSEITDRKKTEFHGNPMPSYDSHLPKRPILPPTNVQPFRFKSQERGEHYKAQLENKLKEEEEEAAKLRQFTSQKASVLVKPPFEPAKSGVPPVTLKPFHMFSNERAVERSKFDESIRKMEKTKEERLKDIEKRTEEAMMRTVREHRKDLVHKAQPVPNMSRRFTVTRSERPLTDPLSPAFKPLPSERRRESSSSQQPVKDCHD